ncbi:MAG: phosphocholine cytidylyltransferase family protein [Archaeoglobales archaeon]|nr:phosphocholine cytidylyltransferase family protein [Archaeoglobales archaeon]
MKAVILAAGMGSRLGNYTEQIPKCMLKVGKKTIIEHAIEVLSSFGIKSFVIVTGHKGRKLRKFLTENFDLDFTFVHNHVYRETNNIYSFYLGIKDVWEDVILLNSDVYFHPGIFERLYLVPINRFLLVVDDQKPLGEEEMKVVIENSKILRISKRIPPKEANGEYIGMAKIPEKYLGLLKECAEQIMEESGAGVFYEDAIQQMIEMGNEVHYVSTQKMPWVEVDFPHELRIAKRVYESFRAHRCQI